MKENSPTALSCIWWQTLIRESRPISDAFFHFFKNFGWSRILSLAPPFRICHYLPGVLEDASRNFPDKLDRWRQIRNRRGRLGTRLTTGHWSPQRLKKLCFCMVSLAVRTRLAVQLQSFPNLLGQSGRRVTSDSKFIKVTTIWVVIYLYCWSYPTVWPLQTYRSLNSCVEMSFLPVDWRESTGDTNFLALWNNSTCCQKRTGIFWRLNLWLSTEMI